MESGSYWLDKVRISIWRDVRTLPIEEAYTTKYSIHPGADTMLCGFRLTNRWLSMKKDIASCGSKYLAYSEVEVEYQGSSGLTRSELKAARDRQKSYADNRRKPLEFKVGDLVMLKVSPWKGVIRFGKKGKLAPRYVGPFKILERIGLVAYRLRLPEELSGVHDTFHVLNLKKCLADASLHVPLDEIKVDKTLRFVEEPVEIMDREVKSLKRSKIALVKVRWNSKRGPEFTWERKDYMKSKHPQLQDLGFIPSGNVVLSSTYVGKILGADQLLVILCYRYQESGIGYWILSMTISGSGGLVRNLIPMIQPDGRSTKDNPKLEIAVLRSNGGTATSNPIQMLNLRRTYYLESSRFKRQNDFANSDLKLHG
ncbi:hypothetical protein Tco_0534424 [Tanacetum coccineum]